MERSARSPIIDGVGDGRKMRLHDSHASSPENLTEIVQLYPREGGGPVLFRGWSCGLGFERVIRGDAVVVVGLHPLVEGGAYMRQIGGVGGVGGEVL